MSRGYSKKISRDDAIKQADEFLAKVGIKDFKAYEGEVYTERVCITDCCNLDGNPCRSYYIIKYMRNINGAFVTAGGEDKFSGEMKGDEYVKKFWSEESIEFRINDNGIVGFDYNVPVKEEKIVVNDSKLKDFSEIKQTFEKMVVIANAQKDYPVDISINKVILGYARISEKNSFDTGLLVPVWDFFDGNNKIVMTINAIDGSVINRQLGY